MYTFYTTELCSDKKNKSRIQARKIIIKLSINLNGKTAGEIYISVKVLEKEYVLKI